MFFVQVKYLGEEQDGAPIAGAASICSPWDLVVLAATSQLPVSEADFLGFQIVNHLKFVTDLSTVDLPRSSMIEFLLSDYRVMHNCISLENLIRIPILLKHQPILSRLVDWDCIRKSRSVRDFDNYVTCLVGKFETVDTYYRRCSSVSYVENVSVPLLCISALDDPVCTKEAIPWDECRGNKNIVLATTTHGGHLAYFEGMGASHIWHGSYGCIQTEL
ncbi:Embryogenesis-associated protein [Nymphaea thermarum]|nr:Embryogenesis-associated protein [Nymphaea thermarum]